jgi:hypothetical protein
MHEMVLGTRASLDEHAQMMLSTPAWSTPNPIWPMSPGQTEDMVWSFNRAGDFDFACLIAGHYQAGMTGVSPSPNNARKEFPMTSTNRRHVLHLLAAAAGMAALPAMAAAPARLPWRSGKTELRLLQGLDCPDEQAGFAVKVHDVGNSAVPRQTGPAWPPGSAIRLVRYLVEGHVPAADVHKLLKQTQGAGHRRTGMPSAAPAWTAPSTAAAKTLRRAAGHPKPDAQRCQHLRLHQLSRLTPFRKT